MKLLRCGNKGSEKPAVLDKNNKIRDLSSHISDLSTKNINFGDGSWCQLHKLNLKIIQQKLQDFVSNTSEGNPEFLSDSFEVYFMKLKPRIQPKVHLFGLHVELVSYSRLSRTYCTRVVEAKLSL